MNIAEGQRLKAVEAEIDALKRSNADLVRRVDEMSAQLRYLTDERTLKLKKSA